MTRGIFLKWSTASLKSEFYFTWTDCITKAKVPSLSFYFIHNHKENKWIHAFPKGISIKWTTDLFRLWIQITNSIYNNNNHNALLASNKRCV